MSKKCISCGLLLEDDDLYCSECGQKQEEAVAAPKKKKGKKPIIIGTAIVVAAIFLFSLLGRSSESPDDSEADSPEVSSPAENDEVDNQVSSQASVDELVACVDQAEEILTNAYTELGNAQDTEYYEGKFRDYTVLLEQMRSDLSAPQTQADAITGLDGALENAKNEYFNMIYDSQKSLSEIWTFMADYFDLGEAGLFYRPQPEEFTSIGEYNTALDAWYQETKAGYDAITSCPPCLESQWKLYGHTLDLNSSICKKLYLAEQYNDALRRQSALNMSERYDTSDELQYGELLNSLQGEVEHSDYQRELAASLAEEIHTYAGLTEEERNGYEFEYVRTNHILLDYDTVDTIYPSLYNSYDAFLVVKTGCVSGTRTILVEAEIPGFTQNYKETFILDSAYKAIYIKPPALTGDLNLSASKSAQMKVTISDKDGALIEAKTFPVTIKSKYDFEWYSDEYGLATKDNILCFLTPEATCISQLKRKAIDEISSMTNGQMESFVGYQNTKWNNHFVGTYLQAAGIMRALNKSGVRYNMDPFSISGSNQHILFPEDVLQQQSGLCIETSLVVASALQSAGMHVFLVFPPGHAQVAVEIWNGRGNDTAGTGQYFLIETTALSDDRNNPDIFIENANELLKDNALNTSSITYYNREGWKNYLAEDTYIVDCDDLGVLGMTPFAN